jgi:hypothetical protein
MSNSKNTVAFIRECLHKAIKDAVAAAIKEVGLGPNGILQLAQRTNEIRESLTRTAQFLATDGKSTMGEAVVWVDSDQPSKPADRAPQSLLVAFMTKIFDDVIIKSRLDEACVMQLFGRVDYLRAAVCETVNVLTVANHFEGDTLYTESLEAFKMVKPIRSPIEQLGILRDKFDPKKYPLLTWPHITETYRYANEVLPGKTLPAGTNWFAVIRPECLANDYFGAVEVVLSMIDVSKHVTSQLATSNQRQLRRSELASRFWELATIEQTGPIVFLAAQMGPRHVRTSPRQVPSTFAPGEFGLDSVSMGCMLATHPDRFDGRVNLGLVALGDEYSFRDDGNFNEVPLLQDGALGLTYAFATRTRGYGLEWLLYPTGFVTL